MNEFGLQYKIAYIKKSNKPLQVHCVLPGDFNKHPLSCSMRKFPLINKTFQQYERTILNSKGPMQITDCKHSINHSIW